MRLPVDVKAVADAAVGIDENVHEQVSLSICCDPAIAKPVSLLFAELLAYEDEESAAKVTWRSLISRERVADPTDDALILVALDGAYAAEVAQRVRSAGVPVLLVLQGVLSAQNAVAAGASSQDILIVHCNEDVVSASKLSGEAVDLARRLGEWLLAACPSKKLALAQMYPFVRRPLADEAVSRTAAQNAGVGVVVIIPGADMPVMTLNQVKMLLQIAAAYGQPMTVARAKELLAVVGGAFAFRTVARNIVGVVPMFGWAVKGAIGYAGTYAMGRAAIAYFEAGGGCEGLSGVVEKALSSFRGSEVCDIQEEVLQ